jgi:hydrogenase/urease accessory protein HupE
VKKGLLLFFYLLLAQVAFAHRLNEYLQATTVSLSHDKVLLELRLTAGTDVAARIIKTVDRNGDKRFSEAEQRAYLAEVFDELSFSVDGRKAVLQLDSFQFPTKEDLTKGIGDIIIGYEAKLPELSGSHVLKFGNSFESAIAVYLVNCLQPADTLVHVTRQTRSTNQGVYQLNFTIGNQASVSTARVSDDDHWASVNTFFIHGIKHILTGYDHLLFLCALVLGAATLWDLVKIVTAFTIAHSITLTLATFGLAHLPEQIVEPVIAASIVFVAVQNIRWPRQSNGNSRLAVAFFFGLFHGLGFAGGLVTIMHSMPPAMIWFAILGFSLGVEAGNQIILLPVYGLLRWLKGQPPSTSITYYSIQRFASGLVAIAGLLYLGFDIYSLF